MSEINCVCGLKPSAAAAIYGFQWVLFTVNGTRDEDLILSSIYLNEDRLVFNFFTNSVNTSIAVLFVQES